jgi:hypothetical protein
MTEIDDFDEALARLSRVCTDYDPVTATLAAHALLDIRLGIFLEDIRDASALHNGARLGNEDTLDIDILGGTLFDRLDEWKRQLLEIFKLSGDSDWQQWAREQESKDSPPIEP